MKKKQWLILAVGAALIISLFMENRGCYRQTCGTGGGNGKPEAGLTGETGNLSAGKDTDPADPEARSTDGANRVADGKSGPTESTENRGINTLEQAVAMVNDNLPVEITGDLRYDSVRIEDGKIYHHYYTFTGPESGLKASLERTAGQSLDRLRSMDEGSPIKYTGLTFVFTYLGPQGEPVHETVVTPDMYR